jgi:ABC-type cobalamin/Fe3+-siderophores transport system ATPase subunit
MVQIDSVDITGYKGIESTKFDPKQMNIITGRNNTGKTSALEAIEVGLNPEYIRGYGDNISHIINLYHDHSSVRLETRNKTVEYHLRKPEPEARENIFIDSIAELVADDSMYPFIDDDERSRELVPDIATSIRQYLKSVDSQDLSKYTDNIMTLEYCGENYHVIYSSRPFYEDLIDGHEQEIIDTIATEINYDIDDVLDENSLVRFERYLEMILGKNRSAMPKKPDGPDDAMIVQYQSLTDDLKPKNHEGSSTEKVELRKYLNEHGITPEPGATIEKFDFDDIVFNRGDRTYQLPYDFMGDGYKTIVGFLWQFFKNSDSNDVIFVEEPENHMHPGYVGQTVDLLTEIVRDEDLQLFVTTHNLDFISEFFGDYTVSKEEFLNENLQIIQMTETVPKIYDYQDAKEQVEDFQVDLRGI